MSLVGPPLSTLSLNLEVHQHLNWVVSSGEVITPQGCHHGGTMNPSALLPMYGEKAIQTPWVCSQA